MEYTQILQPTADDTRSPPMERLSLPAQFCVILYVLAATIYLAWRASTLNPEAPVFSTVIYGAELFGFATTLLHIFMVWRMTVRIAPPPLPDLSVDIFVPSYNEPVDVVRRTLLAAVNVDYPHQTWLLDDGNRTEMAELARELGVRYLARTSNTHAKAGNLNNALRHSTAEFVAIFDADHAPKRNFLHETLGFFKDPGLAFVQTPQDFFNLDSYQHRRTRDSRRVWTEQSLFFRVIQRGKDRWNAAFFCGSCAVLRRSALDRIGGFATHTVTEDLETSVALHGAGYRSVYVPAPLAFGIAPSSADPFLRQRIRWGQGAMQVVRREWFFLRSRLTLAQRLNYMASTTTYFDGWQKAIFYFAPVWVLLTGTMPLIADSHVFLALFIPYFVLTFVVFEETGRGFGRAALIEQYNMARFAAFMWSTLGLLRRNLRFSVTSKELTSAAGTEARMLSPQILVGALNALAILLGILLWTWHRHLPLDGMLANVVWASVNVVMAFAVLQFSLARTRFKRRDYRFPLPLPATVEFDGALQMMTVDDISSSGCRLYGRFPEETAAGETLCGVLHLPGYALPFRARVAALIPNEDNEVRYTKALGIEFDWPDAASRDRLDLFLYGSDLQWLINGMAEQSQTPTERLRRRLQGRTGGAAGTDVWSAVDVRCDTGTPEYGLVSRPANDEAPRILLTYRRVDGESTIAMTEHGRGGTHSYRLRSRSGLARVTTPTGLLYLTEMEPC